MEKICKEITDKRVIACIFKRISRLKSFPVTVNNLSNYLIYENGKFTLKNAVQGEIEIRFKYKNNLYCFFSCNSQTAINIPESLKIFTRRETERFDINDDSVFLCVDENEKYRVVDINTKGVGILGLPESRLENYSIMRNARIHIKDKVFLMDLELMHTSENVYGYRILNFKTEEKLELLKHLIKIQYVNIDSMTDFPTECLGELFQKSGYLSLHGLESDFSSMVNVLKKIDNEPELSKSFVFSENQRMLCCANILRLYNKSFIAQHLASDPDAGTNIKSKLDIYKAILSYLLNLPDFNYYIAYFDRDLNWHRGMYNDVLNYVNNKSLFVLEDLDFYIAKTEASGHHITCKTKAVELKEHEYTEFYNFSKNHIGELESGAFDYVNDVCLKKVNSIYAKYDLYAVRKICKIINGKGSPVCYMAGECFSSGVNLYSCMDAVKIYFAAENSEDISINDLIQSAYHYFNEFYLSHNKSYFYIMISSKHNSGCFSLSDGNIKTSMNMCRVIASRDGADAYNTYFKIIIR